MKGSNGRLLSVFLWITVFFLAAAFSGVVLEEDGAEEGNSVSPARKIDQPLDRVERGRNEQDRWGRNGRDSDLRSIDGVGNNEHKDSIKEVYSFLESATNEQERIDRRIQAGEYFLPDCHIGLSFD